MRPELVENPDLRRDIPGGYPVKRVRKPTRKATAADIAMRTGPIPETFVTSADQGGRRRLLVRFLMAGRLRRAS